MGLLRNELRRIGILKSVLHPTDVCVMPQLLQQD
jgi:hypothetical protein